VAGVCMARYICSLQESKEVAQVGGKAANLQRLTAAGFPVPPGLCVTVEAFRAHLSNHGLQEQIRQVLGAMDFQDVRQVEERARKVRQLIQAHPMPADVEGEIRSAYRDLISSPGRDRRVVVVRSSATTEDLPDASFAGQHDTYLNIVGERQVVSRVIDCWASLWTARAMHYRHAHGLRSQDADMAVVIQEMLLATASGVTFTAHPESGNTGKLLINAAWGLGEGIVSGEVEADTFVVDKGSLATLNVTIGGKAVAVLVREAGGTELVPTEEAKRSVPSLTAEELHRVAELGRSIEEHFGTAQDIEWCVRDGTVFVVQSRPLTGVKEKTKAKTEEFPVQWDNPEDQQYTWTLGREGGEAEPGEPLVPLEQDLLGLFIRGRQNALKISGSRMGRRNQLRVFNGYRYYRHSEMGLSEEEIAELDRRHNARAQAYREQGTTIWRGEILPEILADHDKLFPFPFHERDIEKLLAYMDGVLTVYERHWTLHWMMFEDARSRRWPDTFRELTGVDNPGEALKLLHGTSNKSTELIDGLRGLTRLVQRDQVLKQLFEQTDDEGLLATLQTTPGTAEFLEQLEEYLEEFGYRTGSSFGSITSIATPTWREEPGMVLAIIRLYLAQDLEALEEARKARDREREEAIEAIRQQLRGEPEKLVDFDTQLAIWRDSQVRMEDHNYYLDQKSSALVRLIIVQLGKALQERGALQETEDIFFLTLDEVRRAADAAVAARFAVLVKERRAVYEWWRTLSPPPWLGAPPESEAEGRSGVLSPAQEAVEEEGIIRGIAACSGRYTGRARVIVDPEVIPAVESGDILVAANAGELWTPVFPILGGLVLDEGSPTQHAAVVAREYGVPTVVQAKVATERIQDGQIITVDGSRGTVHLSV